MPDLPSLRHTEKRKMDGKSSTTADWTEGVCADGAAILRDGVRIRISEILATLNAAERWRDLLSEGLDLCVRARKLDDPVIALEPEWEKNPYMTRSATPALWVQDQYDNDLADWETRARKTLS